MFFVLFRLNRMRYYQLVFHIYLPVALHKEERYEWRNIATKEEVQVYINKIVIYADKIYNHASENHLFS